jgi:hypothetical protein
MQARRDSRTRKEGLASHERRTLAHRRRQLVALLGLPNDAVCSTLGSPTVRVLVLIETASCYGVG